MKHDIAELLPYYANGTLDAADRTRVEAELAACASCTEELGQLTALATALRARAELAPPPPAQVFTTVVNRLDGLAAPRVLHARASWWAVPARYATAAALVVGLGGAAVAAWHAHESATAQTTVGSMPAHVDRLTTVYRETPHPNAPQSDDRSTATAVRDAKQVAAAAPSGRALAPSAPNQQPRLAKHARLELAVGDVEAALRAAQAGVRSAGGEVTSLDDASPRSAGAVHGAELDVEVPADRLDATLDALSRLGTVRNRTIAADDIGDALVDEAARLTNLRREERDLRALMDRGGKVDEILSVQQSLSDVRGQIEQLAAQRAHDLHRVATSAIALSLSEDRANPMPAKPGPTARIDGAWHSGLAALTNSVVAIVSLLAWSLAYAPVPMALAGIAYAVARLIRLAAPSP